MDDKKLSDFIVNDKGSDSNDDSYEYIHEDELDEDENDY